jgi:hypothetical protein
MEADLDRALHRVPLLIAVLGVIGAAIAWHFGGIRYSTAFLTGAAAAYFNFRLIERFVARLVGSLAGNPAKRPKFAGFRLFFQLALFLAIAFVILRFSGFNIVVALYGFLVCPAAVMIEAIYFLILTYGHS